VHSYLASLSWDIYIAEGAVAIEYDAGHTSISGFRVSLHPGSIGKSQRAKDLIEWVFTKEVINGLTGVTDIRGDVPEAWKYIAHIPHLDNARLRIFGYLSGGLFARRIADDGGQIHHTTLGPSGHCGRYLR